MGVGVQDVGIAGKGDGVGAWDAADGISRAQLDVGGRCCVMMLGMRRLLG